MAQRVLIIDDVPDILMLATISLEAVGFIALTARDGVEGVELASTSWPDLILCDVHMPRLDGFEVLSALRANAATARIPFVFVTGDQSLQTDSTICLSPRTAVSISPLVTLNWFTQ